jgi:hypothetical protein
MADCILMLHASGEACNVVAYVGMAYALHSDLESHTGVIFYVGGTLASSTVVLTDHRDSEDHNPRDFDYRQVIGKL